MRGVSTERCAALGAGPRDNWRVHEQSLPPGGLPREDLAGGVLREVRQGDDHAKRHRPRNREHPRGICAAQTGGICGAQDPANRRGHRGLTTPPFSNRSNLQPDPELMAQFSVNTQRFDPYKNFKFRVKWDGKYVAGVSKCSALKRTTEVVKHREGGDPSSSRKSPGRTEFEAITLDRGVTHDTEFEQWANKVWNFGSGLGAEVSLKDFRKDIIIEVYNEAGQLALTYKVFRCWVSEFQAQ